MRIAHLSDLHVSRYGISLTGPAHRPVAGVHLIPQRDPKTEGWETVYQASGWEIQWRPRGRLIRGERLRLVDPTGITHGTLPHGNTEQARAQLLQKMQYRTATEAKALAADLPDAAQTARLLHHQPDNTNLRVCAISWQLRAKNPDLVVISGDLTDDGEGYELICAAFAPFIDTHRLLVVPGNHDIYPSPPLLVAPSQRKSLRQKREAWDHFAKQLGRPPGSYVAQLDGVDVALLDSAHPPRVPQSQSGEVLQADLDRLAPQLRSNTVRLMVLHHHVVNPPLDGRAPWQAWMKLRNADAVRAWALRHGVAAILNGHRHVAYQLARPGQPRVFSAPSATKGCKTGAPPTFWDIQIAQGAISTAEARLLAGPPASQVGGAG